MRWHTYICYVICDHLSIFLWTSDIIQFVSMKPHIPANCVSDYESGGCSPETALRPCLHGEAIRICELCELLPVPRPWMHEVALASVFCPTLRSLLLDLFKNSSFGRFLFLCILVFLPCAFIFLFLLWYLALSHHNVFRLNSLTRLTLFSCQFSLTSLSSDLCSEPGWRVKLFHQFQATGRLSASPSSQQEGSKVLAYQPASPKRHHPEAS